MGKRILVVDSDDVMLELLGEMLEEMGFDAVVEESSSRAVTMLLEGTGRFDLILIDHTVAEASEFQLPEMARRMRHPVPVVLITVSWSHLSEEEAKARGIRKLLYKPFTKRELSGVLMEAL
jgi:CheY-like chemotaxis protein